MKPGVATTPDAELVEDAHAVNGESPLWDGRRGRLYWVDMRTPALHVLEPPTSASRRWEMPAWIGSLTLVADGRLVVALRTGLHLFDPERGGLSPLAQAPYDARRFSLNDGTSDREGRFLVGAMHHQLSGGVDGGDTRTPLWRYDGDGPMTALNLPPVTIANGLALAPDGRTLYFADTSRKTIWTSHYDPHAGAAAAPRVFALVEEGGVSGGPDGATVDSEGFYICAVFGAGCLLRFDPQGRLERRIRLPVLYPTKPALGGADLSTLYVTSASFPQTPDERRAQPHAGGLFALEAPARGLPASYMKPPKERSA
jgi:sugar lactone lactonase YvrE